MAPSENEFDTPSLEYIHSFLIVSLLYGYIMMYSTSSLVDIQNVDRHFAYKVLFLNKIQLTPEVQNFLSTSLTDLLRKC